MNRLLDIASILNPTDVLLGVCAGLLLLVLVTLTMLLNTAREIGRNLRPSRGFAVRTEICGERGNLRSMDVV